ncbi:MAG: hypothetical protein II749_04835 [Clostridia bacterium]|nr:hypothetical protein [Clostridia bacterium]
MDRSGTFLTNREEVHIGDSVNTLIVGCFDENAADMIGYTIISGSLPSNKDEICLIQKQAEALDLKEGDTLKLSCGTYSGEYTVSGIINSYVDSWRKNPYGYRDMKLNNMPEALVHPECDLISEHISNAIVLMKKVNGNDSSHITLETFANTLFNGDPEYDKHVYYTELDSQGFGKYSIFSGQFIGIAINVVLVFFMLLYVKSSTTFEKRNGATQENVFAMRRQMFGIAASVILAGLICLAVSLAFGQLFRIRGFGFVMHMVLITAVGILLTIVLKKACERGKMSKLKDMKTILLVILTILAIVPIVLNLTNIPELSPLMKEYDVVYFGSYLKVLNISAIALSVVSLAFLLIPDKDRT